jgi:release factor glutamine methyltransferase
VSVIPASEVADRVRSILVTGGVEDPAREARWIVEAATGHSESASARDSRSIDDGDASDAVGLAQRRAAGEPLQYVTGVAGFRYLELAVGPGVMVPRPETEIVAEWAMAKLPRGGVVVDCGTGSGAIALSIAKERPDARVLATENAPAALSWAERNRAALGLDVELIPCDLLERLGSELRGKIDVVVSNPPYVALFERDLLPREVAEHEPHDALFAGEEGLDVIGRLVWETIEWLRPGGWVVTEIGESQAAAVRGLLADRSYEEVATHEDLTGRPRVAMGRKPL